jgi:hypothetical protein
MRSQQFLQAGISVSYEAATTIVMKKIKHRRSNEKRKDSIKKILGVLYTTSHSKSYRIMMTAAIKKWKCHIRMGHIKNIFKQ